MSEITTMRRCQKKKNLTNLKGQNDSLHTQLMVTGPLLNADTRKFSL